MAISFFNMAISWRLIPQGVLPTFQYGGPCQYLGSVILKKIAFGFCELHRKKNSIFGVLDLERRENSMFLVSQLNKVAKET